MITTLLFLACLVYGLYCILASESTKYTEDSHVIRPRAWCFGCQLARLLKL